MEEQKRSKTEDIIGWIIVIACIIVLIFVVYSVVSHQESKMNIPEDDCTAMTCTVKINNNNEEYSFDACSYDEIGQEIKDRESQPWFEEDYYKTQEIKCRVY